MLKELQEWRKSITNIMTVDIKEHSILKSELLEIKIYA